MRAKLPLALALLATSSLVRADVLFSFGGDYISTASANNARLAIGSGSGPYLETLTFDTVTPMSPASNYSGPTYYGGFQFSSSTINGSINRQQIRDGGATDSLYLQSSVTGGWVGSTLSLHVVYLFKQADWLSGHQSGTNAISSLSMSNNSFSAGEGRFVVEIGGAYFVSQSTVSTNGAQTLTLNAAALATEQWAAYNPATNINFDQTATFSTISLTSLTAVGVYFERDSFAGGASNTPFGLGVTSLTVEGTTTTVPEPGAYALLVGVAGLGAAAFSRRRKA